MDTIIRNAPTGAIGSARMNELTLAVVGIAHANADRSNRLFEILLCRPGEPVELRPEPRNKHDPNAVAVWSARGQQIGYLTAERAPWVGRRIAAEGYRAIFQGRGETAAYVRVAFGDHEPTLPTVRSVGAPGKAEAEFYPDDDGPEWGA